MALITCPECGHQISDKADSCPNCGCPVEKKQIIKCEECGQELPEGCSECPNCGCPVETTVSSNISTATNEGYTMESSDNKISQLPKASKSNVGKSFIILVVYVILGILGFTLSNSIYWSRACDWQIIVILFIFIIGVSFPIAAIVEKKRIKHNKTGKFNKVRKILYTISIFLIALYAILYFVGKPQHEKVLKQMEQETIERNRSKDFMVEASNHYKYYFSLKSDNTVTCKIVTPDGTSKTLYASWDNDYEGGRTIRFSGDYPVIFVDGEFIQAYMMGADLSEGWLYPESMDKTAKNPDRRLKMQDKNF